MPTYIIVYLTPVIISLVYLDARIFQLVSSSFYYFTNTFMVLTYTTPVVILGLRPANETALLCNVVSHWLGANLVSALPFHRQVLLRALF